MRARSTARGTFGVGYSAPFSGDVRPRQRGRSWAPGPVPLAPPSTKQATGIRTTSERRGAPFLLLRRQRSASRVPPPVALSSFVNAFAP